MKVLALIVARGLKLVCRFGGRVSGTWGPHSRGTYAKDDNVLGSIEGPIYPQMLWYHGLLTFIQEFVHQQFRLQKHGVAALVELRVVGGLSIRVSGG